MRESFSQRIHGIDLVVLYYEPMFTRPHYCGCQLTSEFLKIHVNFWTAIEPAARCL